MQTWRITPTLILSHYKRITRSGCAKNHPEAYVLNYVAIINHAVDLFCSDDHKRQ